MSAQLWELRRSCVARLSLSSKRGQFLKQFLSAAREARNKQQSPPAKLRLRRRERKESLGSRCRCRDMGTKRLTFSLPSSGMKRFLPQLARQTESPARRVRGAASSPQRKSKKLFTRRQTPAEKKQATRSRSGLQKHPMIRTHLRSHLFMANIWQKTRKKKARNACEREARLASSRGEDLRLRSRERAKRRPGNWRKQVTTARRQWLGEGADREGKKQTQKKRDSPKKAGAKKAREERETRRPLESLLLSRREK
ncbi:hypothetical protein TGDOM2_294651B [Toxoplasma gondii GAB2-2007-GAL-DOM2]|uniref:Uncharacterized protein n=1 Tax=Toxoplasma gondii GAB2-2007-GAL-DOM2 TaxID=1130820 RepID=A0A086J9L5_TOXGO|nr:hypothetical protein TGDOM2_294651B [Toxoplasma gondii GAB2-2007-GAL-DOM2]